MRSVDPLHRFLSIRWSAHAWTAAALASLVVVAGCGQRVTVRGSTTIESASGDSSTAQVVSLTHSDAGTTTRLVTSTPSSNASLESMGLQLVNASGDPWNETYVFALMSRVSPLLPPTAPDAVGNLDWIVNHTGNVAVMSMRQNGASSSTFSGLAAAPVRPRGRAWLARVEDGGAAAPWLVGEGSATAQLPMALGDTMAAPPGGETTDNFDVQTLATMLLTRTAIGVTEAVGSIDVPLVGVGVSNHELWVVPRLEHSALELRGFGFVYSSEIQVSVVGVGVVELHVWVPISILIRQDKVLVIDPMDMGDQSDAIGRIAVTYGNPAGQLVAQLLHDGITAALPGIQLPPIPVLGVDLSVGDTIWLGLTSIAGVSSSDLVATLPANYDFLALPAGMSGDFATTSLALKLPLVMITLRTTNQEDVNPLPTGLSILADGSVRRVVNQDPAGVVQKVTQVFPVEVVTPFELHLLF